MQVETFKKISSELTPYSDNKHNVTGFQSWNWPQKSYT